MDLTAINIVRAFSIIYLGLYLVDLYGYLFGPVYNKRPFADNNMMYFYYFGKPSALLIFIVGLSIDKVSQSKIFRGITSLFLFIPYFTILSYINYKFFNLQSESKYWSYDVTFDTWRNLMYGLGFILITYIVHSYYERK